MVGSDNNVFDSITSLLNRISFTYSRFSLSYICKLVLDNKARLSHTPMWDIIRLPHRLVCADICLEDEEKMIQRMKSIIYLCILTCDSCLTKFRTSGSEIGWTLGFELGF